jgi:integrase
VGKAQVSYPDGHYELRHYEGRKTIWANVGDEAAEAQAKQQQLARTLKAEDAAEEAGTKIIEIPGRVDLATQANAFEQRQLARGKKRHSVTFRQAIDEFVPLVRAKYADQLTEESILTWYAALRKKGNSNRTIYNKHVSVFGYLKWAGVDIKKLAAKAPTFTEKVVEIYRPEQMRKFFSSLKAPYHRVVFEVLLKTGLRMQEAMYLEWHQFDWQAGTLTVKERNEDGFEIKDRAERTLPIPADLIEHLKAWQEVHGGRLVLGTSNDTPNWKWLPLLKRLVQKAGLNCGHCKGCREQGECEHWYLHKFRATYITSLLRSGIDPRTVMEYSGHEDLKTIMRYLAPAELPETQQRVNAIDWGV